MTEDSVPILAPAPRTEPIVIPGRDPVPVTLLTGFLGAGKTTLLNRILNGQHGLRVGVLINDFGAINIDAELVDGVEENTISLTNGCVCCEIRDDLVNSLEQLLTREDAIDYVLLEASGVADPEGIVMTFLDQKYEKLLRLDSITCIVDAEAVFTHGDNAELSTLKMRQIGFADMVVLNKVDLVGPEHIEVIRPFLDWLEYGPPVVRQARREASREDRVPDPETTAREAAGTVPARSGNRSEEILPAGCLSQASPEMAWCHSQSARNARGPRNQG